MLLLLLLLASGSLARSLVRPLACVTVRMTLGVCSVCAGGQACFPPNHRVMPVGGGPAVRACTLSKPDVTCSSGAHQGRMWVCVSDHERGGIGCELPCNVVQRTPMRRARQECLRRHTTAARGLRVSARVMHAGESSLRLDGLQDLESHLRILAGSVHVHARPFTGTDGLTDWSLPCKHDTFGSCLIALQAGTVSLQKVVPTLGS